MLLSESEGLKEHIGGGGGHDTQVTTDAPAAEIQMLEAAAPTRRSAQRGR